MAAKKSGIGTTALGFVDYFWPRVFIFTSLYWLAVLTEVFQVETTAFMVGKLGDLVQKLTSVSSILVFLTVSGFFCILEFLFRLGLARKGKVKHWFFVRANRLSVVGLEIFLGLLSVTSVLSMNIMLHLAVLGDRVRALIPQDQNLRRDYVANITLSLAILVLLFFYKSFVTTREDKLTRRFKAKK